jgi:uncharacterized protein
LRLRCHSRRVALRKILDKAAEHAVQRKFDPAVLVNARLAPDMYPLARQVQIACDFAKNSSGRLAGEEPPRLEDNGNSLDELKARIAETLDYLKTPRAAAFAGSEDRQLKVPLPNFYFLVVTSYDILRHDGVEIGKRDYLAHA